MLFAIKHRNTDIDNVDAIRLGLLPVPDFPGCPGFVPCGSASQQDQPRDAKCPGFQVACSLLSSGNTAVQSCRHCNWQIGSIFVASYKCTGSGGLQITATKIDANHICNSKSVPGVLSPDADRLGAPPQPPVPDWESEKVATLDKT